MPDRFFSFWSRRSKPTHPRFDEVIVIQSLAKPTETAPIDETPEPIKETPMDNITYVTGPIIQPEHTLLLLFAEDFYKGHAKVQITIDDQPVFTQPHPVTARRDRMQQEVITVRGEWPTPPQVSITFANDLWDGTDDTDRNLFFYGGSYDGVQITYTHKFFHNGTITFSPPASV